MAAAQKVPVKSSGGQTSGAKTGVLRSRTWAPGFFGRALLRSERARESGIVYGRRTQPARKLAVHIVGATGPSAPNAENFIESLPRATRWCATWPGLVPVVESKFKKPKVRKSVIPACTVPVDYVRTHHFFAIAGNTGSYSPFFHHRRPGTQSKKPYHFSPYFFSKSVKMFIFYHFFSS